MKVVTDISKTQKDTLSIINQFTSESPISLLGLSRRSFNALTKNGYDIVDKILTLDEESLKAIDNLGEKSIKEIIEIQKRLRKQGITTEDDYIEIINIPDCRFIKTRETIYPRDFIGFLDISINAHNVLYNAGIFSVRKLFKMKKEDINNLKNASREISDELYEFIVKEKPFVGKRLDKDDINYYIQEKTQEQQNNRMNILEEKYKKINQNLLDKSLNLFLQGYNDEKIKIIINHLSPILNKINKISDIKHFFSVIIKTSRTNDVNRILELLSIDLNKSLNETFEPFFSDPRYADSLEILYQRANGFTLRSIAEKLNLSHERIRQKERKSVDKLVSIIMSFHVNIISFICAVTGNNDYISTTTICEYLEKFIYSPQILYLLENENIYTEYQYNRQYDVFYLSELELDFSTIDIKRPVKELILNDMEVELGKKIEDFLIRKKLVKCTYNDICNFFESEAGYVKVGKIIRLNNNIVEIEKDRFVHRSCIIDFDEAAERLLVILKNQFRQFHGYSNSHILYDAARIDLSMFMNDNGLETESIIYMLVKHIFFKEKYKGNNFLFTDNLHIWEKQATFPQNNKGVLINLAMSNGGIITRDEIERYIDKLKISRNIIIHKMHDISDSTFYFYKETTYILSEYLQIDNVFISYVKKSLDKLFDNRRYIIPSDINEDWFDTLPALPIGLPWNLLLLQDIIRYNEEIGYKPLFSDIEQSPYRISGAFVKKDSVDTLVEIIYGNL